MSTGRTDALPLSDEAETIRALAVELVPRRPREIPESAAWGVSPIETYFNERLVSAPIAAV